MTTYTEINKLLADIETKYAVKHPNCYESVFIVTLKMMLSELLTGQFTPEQIINVLKKELD